MTETVVKASTGRALGSRSSRRLRADGDLPAVVYGLGKDPVAVSVSYLELKEALSSETGLNTLLTLDIEGSTETVLCKSVQRDPIKRMATHADFMRVDPETPVMVKVPIRLVGDSTAVTSVGGMVEQKRFELEIEVVPTNIPTVIEADMSIMSLDRRLAVSDLQLPGGATTSIPLELSVAAPVIPRAVLQTVTEDEEGLEGEEGVEGEEGEEGEGGEGAESSDADGGGSDDGEKSDD